MDYIFQFGPMDTTALLPQVSEALKKRAELVSQVRYPTRAQKICAGILGAAYLGLGATLLAVGLAKPRDRAAPLAAGAVGTGAGAGLLLYSLLSKKAPFDEAARQLLENLDTLPHDQTVQAVFSPVGMILVDGKDAKTILYHDVDHIIEVEDIFLITAGERTTVLQKKDLTGDLDGFRAFLDDRTNLI